MKGFKTIIFGALIAALGSIQAVDLATIVPENLTGLVMGAIGLAIMGLRSITNTPLGSSEPK
jgi:hypothetical protein